MKLICGWLSQGVSHEVCLVKSRTDLELAELITSASVCACVRVCVRVRVWESEREREGERLRATDSLTIFFTRMKKLPKCFSSPRLSGFDDRQNSVHQVIAENLRAKNLSNDLPKPNGPPVQW